MQRPGSYRRRAPARERRSVPWPTWPGRWCRTPSRTGPRSSRPSGRAPGRPRPGPRTPRRRWTPPRQRPAKGRRGGWAAGQPPWTAPQLVIAQRLAAGGRPELLARHSICQISRAGGLRLAAKVRLSRSGCVVDGAGASEPGSRPHADGLACAVWLQLATFAVWSRSPRAGAKLSAADGSSCVVSGSLRAGIVLTPGRSCMLSGW